jgi:hypothetical protein
MSSYLTLSKLGNTNENRRGDNGLHPSRVIFIGPSKTKMPQGPNIMKMAK